MFDAVSEESAGSAAVLVGSSDTEAAATVGLSADSDIVGALAGASVDASAGFLASALAVVAGFAEALAELERGLSRSAIFACTAKRNAFEGSMT